MRASLKLLLWLLAGTGMLLVVLVALLFFVDVNLYRDRIERQVSTAFGREVVLDGPLTLEPSLTPRFKVNGLKIGNPDWASRPFLATVDTFDIRVSLLHLLRGELVIAALEFHGVDLRLEETLGGANNFTFGGSGEPAALPAIEHMTLYDTNLAYAGPGRPAKRMHLAKVTARKVPGQPVELEAHTAVNSVPVVLSFRGEPRDAGQASGPWRISLLGEAGDLSLRIEGRLEDPADWQRGEYRLDLKGPDLDDLESLSEYPMPEAEPVELGATLRFDLEKFIAVDGLTGRFGSNDLRGRLRWETKAARPLITARLESQRLVAGDPTSGDEVRTGMELLDRPFDIDTPGEVDLDVEFRVARLEGLAKPLEDIVVSARTDQEQLRFAVDHASMDDTQITASASVPWGEHLAALAAGTVNLRTVLQHTGLDIQARAPDAIQRYATSLMGEPLDLAISSVRASARPGAPITIRAEAALDGKPVTVTLQGEPLAALARRPTGPWQDLALEARGDDIRLDATGSIARPFEAGGIDVRFALNGPDIGALLPLHGAWSFTGHYADLPDRQVLDDLEITLGRSNIGGRVVLHQEGERPRLVARLDAGLLQVDDLLPESAGETSATAGLLDEPLDIGGLGTLDLDMELRVRELDGLTKPVQDVLLTAHADRETLTLAPFEASLEGTRLDARVRLPWGERLAALGNNGVRIPRLTLHADLAIRVQLADERLHHRTDIVGHPVELALTALEATAPPGEALQLNAKARLNDEPVRVSLQAEPLAQLLQRPTGPWRDLALEIEGGDIRLQASGSVDRPFEARGFDIDYALRGAEIAALLPLFDLILSLEGAYSLSGHFADRPEGVIFDQLKILTGRSDIGGQISVYPGEQRPRLVADLHSEQIYLGELLPASESGAEPGAEQRLIPDYNLPIERMREFDGELRFTGKRLRTAAGDLGDIHFTATQQDGVFRIDPFRVRGWAGARIDSDATIDAAQDPPRIDVQWIARQLNYGVLLEQAGFAETVEGTLDITLRLSGKGRTRREFLADADGQLIIVGQEGRFGSRRLDLWGSDLVTTMLSRQWRREDVTDLNCLVARVGIEDGIASSDDLLVDTRRITIGAAGTLDLESEELNLVFAPRPKRASLVSLTSPVRVTGTMATPEVAVTVLPRRRMAAAGTGALAGLVNPAYLLFTFSRTGSGESNPCAAAVEEAMAMKGRADELEELTAASPPARFSLLPGCAHSGQRRAQ